MTPIKTAYLAAEGFENDLFQEISALLPSHLIRTHGRLIVTDAPPRDFVWAENVWLDPREIPVASITDAAKKLKALAPFWTAYSAEYHRRTTLIQEHLPKVRVPELTFLGPLPDRPWGAWTLLDPNLILASPQTTSRFPNGEFSFQENRSAPPSRAYLKLWELFTLEPSARPRPGERCLDLGSSPGGWTWVLAQMGCKVLSVDRAPLDPKIARMPHIEFLKRSAFGLKPEEIGPVDWLFSDIICFPSELLKLVETWRQSGLCRNFVCTIKFKGQTDFAAMAAFASLPGSKIRHLHHNKHEVTWWNLASDEAET